MSSSEFKLRAKDVLKTTYWMSFLAVIIYMLLYSVGTGIGNTVRNLISGASLDFSKYMEYVQDGDAESAMEYVREVYYGNPVGSLIGSLVSVAVTIFLINVLSVGLNNVFVKARMRRSVDISDLFGGFKSYMPVVKTMFFHSLYIFLWGLLFVIPGIVKSYSYFMVPYIMTENPNLDTKRAFEISKTTMNGEKGNCFILSLSFIGWYLLGYLACCIGIYFVVPYHNAAMAEFYAYVKNKAISTGIASPSEFGEAAAPVTV